ncbi:TRASH domain-containing protein [Clostridium sp. AF32-12BH]|nr:TRASH domain-containing protein [Clostridium sp. AF32-12BH]
MYFHCGNVSRHAGTAPADFAAGEKEGKMKEYMCEYCGKVISGEHVMIKTQRGTELHICKGCIEKERHQREAQKEKP